MAEFKWYENKKSYGQIFLIEAPIVGISLVLLFILIFILLNLITWFKKHHNTCMIYSVLISGMIFHILYEYSGVNTWYSRDYCERLNQQN